MDKLIKMWQELKGCGDLFSAFLTVLLAFLLTFAVVIFGVFVLVFLQKLGTSGEAMQAFAALVIISPLFLILWHQKIHSSSKKIVEVFGSFFTKKAHESTPATQTLEHPQTRVLTRFLAVPTPPPRHSLA